MTTIQAVSATTHAGKSWKFPVSYSFASKDTAIPLAWHELPQATMYLPLALMKQQDRYQLVALLGLSQGENLVVGPQGDWLMEYVPVAYRCVPFRIGRNNEGNYVLCVDQAYGTISDGKDGKPFIDADKQLTAEVKGIAESLVKLENERKQISMLCSQLDELGLIEPWPLQVKMGPNNWQLDALFRINETRLSELSGEQLLKVRDAGGLNLCYAQLLSMQHIQRLAKFTQLKAMAKQQAATQQPAFALSDNNGTISFDGL